MKTECGIAMNGTQGPQVGCFDPPLARAMMGQEVTETLKWFDNDRTIDKISEVKLPDGSVMHFQFKRVRE